MSFYILKLVADNEKISKEYLRHLWKYKWRILWKRSKKSELQEKIRLLKLQLLEKKEDLELFRSQITRLAEDRRLLQSKLSQCSYDCILSRANKYK